MLVVEWGIASRSLPKNNYFGYFLVLNGIRWMVFDVGTKELSELPLDRQRVRLRST